MIKDLFFYFVLPIGALVICSLFGTFGLVVALVMTVCVQGYSFRQSRLNNHKLDELRRLQNGLDEALNVEREEDGTVANITIDGGEY